MCFTHQCVGVVGVVLVKASDSVVRINSTMETKTEQHLMRALSPADQYCLEAGFYQCSHSHRARAAQRQLLQEELEMPCNMRRGADVALGMEL